MKIKLLTIVDLESRIKLLMFKILIVHLYGIIVKSFYLFKRGFPRYKNKVNLIVKKTFKLLRLNVFS